MKLRIPGSLAAIAVLCAPVAAQNCSTLAISTSSDGTTQTVTITVDGSMANAGDFLAFGQTPGQTDLNFTLGSVTIGLDEPFGALFLGTNDDQGDLSLSFDAPADLGLTLYGQSVSYGFDFGPPPALDFCTSNVVSVDL